MYEQTYRFSYPCFFYRSRCCGGRRCLTSSSLLDILWVVGGLCSRFVYRSVKQLVAGSEKEMKYNKISLVYIEYG